MKKKVIYCAPIFGYPAIGGPELKVKNVLITLSNIYEVKLILWKAIDNPEFKRFVEERKIQVFNVKRSEFRSLKITSRILSGKALTALRIVCHKLTFELARDRKLVAQSIVSIAKQANTDIVWFSYSNYHVNHFLDLRKYGSHLKLIADTDSVSSRYTLRGIPFVGNRKKIKFMIEGFREIKNEIRLVKNSDVLTAVSEVDLAYYSSLSNSNKISLAYNVIDTSDYYVQEFDTSSKYVIITGSFGHFDSPMDHGTRWFINSVWPKVKEELPELKLRIVGKNSDVVWSGLNEAGIDVLGWVPETKSHIANAAACIVPLWFESGTRYKILEAGILKTPVISTTLGAEGLKIEDGKDLLIANQPKHFAQQIIKILGSTSGETLSENLYAKVKDFYSIESLEPQLIRAVNLASSEY